MSDLKETVNRILVAEGALVEPSEPDGLAIMAPPSVREALGIPEWAVVGFGPELPPGASNRVTLESDWLERLEGMMGNRGRFTALSLHDAPRISASELGALAKRQICLTNATYRLGEIGAAQTTYLILGFRVTAVSEEKRDDLLWLGVNESNGAEAEHMAQALASGALWNVRHGEAIDPQPGMPSPWPADRIRALAEAAVPTRSRVALAPFMAGMERRMSRDLERLRIYHEDLRREVADKIAKQARRNEPEENQARERMRREAIEREYLAKVADVQRKYALSVRVELLQAARIAAPVLRLHLTLLRRKGARSYHLDWNSLSRKLDALPCESCRKISESHALCDARLHMVCPGCLSACPGCRKIYCRACFSPACPACGLREKRDGGEIPAKPYLFSSPPKAEN
ncbi:MAG: hypothetical protein V1929_08965 [bacterium]